jgi:hypothetical protein
MSPGRFDKNVLSISVEPRPSSTSTPVTSRQRSPICAGKASPAETQSRRRSEPAPLPMSLCASSAV